MREIIKLQNIHKDYRIGAGKVEAIEAVNLMIKRGTL
jgi:ABC-type lipoprotein export system ATPase subunit